MHWFVHFLILISSFVNGCWRFWKKERRKGLPLEMEEGDEGKARRLDGEWRGGGTWCSLGRHLVFLYLYLSSSCSCCLGCLCCLALSCFWICLNMLAYAAYCFSSSSQLCFCTLFCCLIWHVSSLPHDESRVLRACIPWMLVYAVEYAFVLVRKRPMMSALRALRVWLP